MDEIVRVDELADVQKPALLISAVITCLGVIIQCSSDGHIR